MFVFRERTALLRKMQRRAKIASLQRRTQRFGRFATGATSAAEGGTRHCNAVLRRVQPKNQLNLGAQSER
jgi:hypothetical protein